MKSNEDIYKNEVYIDGENVHLLDQKGLIIGIVGYSLNVYKIDGNKLIDINKIKIQNLDKLKGHKKEIKLKSENKMNLLKE